MPGRARRASRSRGRRASCRATTSTAHRCRARARRLYPRPAHSSITSPGPAAAQALGSGNRSRNRDHRGTTRSTWVCCSITSATRTAHGSRVRRQGRSRAERSHHARTASTSTVRQPAAARRAATSHSTRRAADTPQDVVVAVTTTVAWGNGKRSWPLTAGWRTSRDRTSSSTTVARLVGQRRDPTGRRDAVDDRVDIRRPASSGTSPHGPARSRPPARSPAPSRPTCAGRRDAHRRPLRRDRRPGGPSRWSRP